MAATKELIKRIRLTASAASITFYNIPQDFDGLELVVSARSSDTTYADDGIRLEFNGTTTTYTARNLYGTGTSVGSHTQTGYAGSQSTDAATANTFGSTTIFIPNYTSSNQKSFSGDGVSENNASGAFQLISAGLWSGTAAITDLKLSPKNGANFKQYSSAALYGWKKGSDGITSVA